MAGILSVAVPVRPVSALCRTHEDFGSIVQAANYCRIAHHKVACRPCLTVGNRDMG